MPSAIWTGHLTFGLVSIPVKLFRAARAEKVHMHLLQRKTGERVRRVFVPADNSAEDTEEDTARKTVAIDPPPRAAEPKLSLAPRSSPPTAIPQAELARGFEYEKDKYVHFEPRELEDLAPRNSTEMQIVEFVNFAEVDPVYLENSYYVAPSKNGEKPYTLLFEALRKTGQSALAEFVLHRRDQIMLLRAGRHGIIGHGLFHEDEVRPETEFRADPNLIVPGEVDLAIRLIGALEAHFEPAKFKDKYRERLQAAISKKIADMPPEAITTTRTTPVVDIMAALKASLSQARKPVAKESNASSAGSGSAASAPVKKKRTGGA